MLGNVAPRALRIISHPTVYSGRDNVTSLTLEVLSDRRYRPLDLSGVTRWLLVFPQTTPQVMIDSATETVFSVTGNVLTVDLSGYAVDASIQPCWLVAYDAEHPRGQVLVDNEDCVVSFTFRAVSGTGLTPLPVVEYVNDAPLDGKSYVRRDGGWVEATALVSGVSTVNGLTGDVTLNAAAVGADPSGSASAAVANHAAALDPHPQYLTATDADAAYDAAGAAAAVAASLAAVATTGAYGDLAGLPIIPSAAADVGADPAGTASAAVSSHVAAADPHGQYVLESEKGAVSGVATLDAGGKIPLAQLPATAITDTFVVNTEAAMLALSAQVGDVAIRPDISTSFLLRVEPASVLGNWQQILSPSAGGGAAVGSATPQALGSATPGVSSNASREDHVHPMPTAGDVGAAAVNHTHAEATTGAAGFMSAADKSKLDGVAAGATANSSDATLLDRANHTGTQAVSTVTGLQAALDKALFAPVVTETGTARTSLLSDAGSYLRFTSTSAKAYTVQPQASVAWVADTEIHGRNVGTNNLTLTAGSGVTLNAPFGGTLLVPTGGSFTLKRVAENVWDVIGQTVAA